MTVWRRFEIPEVGEVFAQSNSRCVYGVSEEKIALATRAYLQVHDPDNFLENVEAYVKLHGWEMICTLPHMPIFQPFEMFLQKHNQYMIFR